MQKTILAVAVLALAASFSNAAMAKPYKWCLDGSGDTPRCYYRTLTQCQASASGRGADCSVNPKLMFGKNRPAKSMAR